jgi:hypothetical protein
MVAGAQSAADLSPEQWREDIQFVHETIPAAHVNAFHTLSEDALHAELADLEAKVDVLAPYQIVLELMRIVAMLGDGHSQLRAWDSGLLRAYPVALLHFDDGIYVVAARENERLIGAKVLRVGDTDAEAVWTAVGKYVPRDNEWDLRAWTRLFADVPEALHELGIVENMDAAEWTFRLPDGERVTETLSPIPMREYFTLVNAIEAPDGAPMFRRDRDRAYWIKHFPEHDAVYMRFNSVRNGEETHLAGFSRELIAFIEDMDADFLVVDARDNGGGNGDLLRPLIRRIADHERINRRGHLYLITNGNTFSAAMMLVTRMERETQVLFVGEPAGGNPNHYGDAEEHALPHSKLILRLSTRYHEESDPGDKRAFQDVDIPVAVTGIDYFANRDPVLDAVWSAIDRQRAAGN